MFIEKVLAGAVVGIGLNAIKDKLSDKHSEYEIKKDIRKFVEIQFKEYKHLSYSGEIDYNSLLDYLSKELPDEIKIYLFDTDIDRRNRCRDDIVTMAYSRACSPNDSQKEEIKKLINASLDIAKEYYVGKLDGNYKLLHNITVESILGPLSEKMDKLSAEINKVSEKVDIVSADIKKMSTDIEEIKAGVATLTVTSEPINQALSSSKEFSYRGDTVSKIYSDNELYASNFNEVLFLHKNTENPIRLCNIFVPHKYENINHYKNTAYEELTLDQFRPSDDILDYIKQFLLGRHLDDGSEDLDFPYCLFIEGDAGVGKSSLVSYLAHLYVDEASAHQNIFGNRKLVCVRLREIIPENMKFSRDSINQNILQYLGIKSPEELKKQYAGSVFVLDGFDELCMIEGISLNADRYISDLYRLFEDCRLIITTRPKYLNLFAIEIPKLHIILEHFDSQQRKKWVGRYRECNPDSGEGFALDYIENINDDDAIGICDTPMALYMIAAGKINEEAKKNHWALYHQIFYKELNEREYNSVFPTAKDGVHRHPISVYRDQLYQVGAEIAYKIYTRSNTRLFLTKDEVLEIVENMEILNADIKELVKRCYAICSYWKANGDKGVVEFYHNNIRDFFMCEKIVYEVNELYKRCENMSMDLACEKIAKGLYALFHHSEVNAKVMEFFYLRVLYHKDNGDAGSFIKIEQTKKFIEEVLSFFIYGKLKVQQEDEFRNVYYSMIDAFANVVQLYRHAFEPYLDKEKSVIDWGLGDVSGISSRSPTVFTSNHFKRIFIKEPLIIGGNIIYTAGRANFNGVRLDGADLRFAGFSHCKMRIANLSSTVLTSATFEGSDLTGTSFEGADLCYVSFKDCIIEDCDFTGANLVGAIFPDGCSFENANEAVEYLKNANIKGIKV